MLPNDPMLALRSAQDTMAQRHYEAAQERLAAHLPRPKRSIRPGTLFVTIVVALTAVFGAMSTPVPTTAAGRRLATSPSTSIDQAASRMRVL
jgi:thioredoxin-like negative regulator of GroEL